MRKNVKTSIWIVAILLVAQISGCKSEQQDKLVAIAGETMGTTYTVQYRIEGDLNFKQEIDSILRSVNQSMSTYIPNSIISGINRSDTTGMFKIDKQFYHVFVLAREINQGSDGAFDPTVMPLVNFWGFGYADEITPDTSQIDSLNKLVGFHHFAITKAISPSRSKTVQDTSYLIEKKHKGSQLDFSAIAKGYGVDLICEFLSSKNISDYFVEIGGEVRVNGNFKPGQPWRVGIENPLSSIKARQLQSVIHISEKAVATSGNYRNYRVVDGRKIVHTINPKTGYSEMSNLLSATVYAENCATADGYATACMVLGLEKSKELVAANSKLEGYFIYSNDTGEILSFASSGFAKLLQKKE